MTLGERAEATIGKLVMENMNLDTKLEKLQAEYDKVRAEYDSIVEKPNEKPPTSKPSLKPVS